MRWLPQIASRQQAVLTLRVEAVATTATGFAALPSPWAPAVEVVSRHPALAPLVRRSLDDLGSLLLVDVAGDGDRFAAAGVPWFMTLFGRDSLWAARFALPVDVRLAGGTLRTLARRQATAVDAATAAEPGKILHEVRAVPAQIDEHHRLPPLYYGTVDATPLWISLLHDAWCWGLPDGEVADLLDALVAAIDWLVGHGGFLAYHDRSGHGLANQGWKDSGDSIQHADGTIATPPVTLCEVQGYAYRAALDGARLLAAFGRPGAAAAEAFADQLRAGFRSAFWTADRHGPFPALALDGAGRHVDSHASNIGHLPGTGILDADEIAVVAGRLGDPLPRQRLRAAHAGRRSPDVQPARLPLGQRLAARHGHRHRRAGGDGARRRRRAAGVRVDRRRRALRVPAPRALRRLAGDVPAAGLPGGVPAAGVGGGLPVGHPARRARVARRRPGGAGRPCVPIRPSRRCSR